jgi:hypothetical protein
MSLLMLHYKSLLLQVRKSAIIERSSKMLVLPVKEQKYGSIAARKYVRTTTPRVHGDEVKHGRYAKLLKKDCFATESPEGKNSYCSLPA